PGIGLSLYTTLPVTVETCSPQPVSRVTNAAKASRPANMRVGFIRFGPGTKIASLGSDQLPRLAGTASQRRTLEVRRHVALIGGPRRPPYSDAGTVAGDPNRAVPHADIDHGRVRRNGTLPDASALAVHDRGEVRLEERVRV